MKSSNLGLNARLALSSLPLLGACSLIVGTEDVVQSDSESANLGGETGDGDGDMTGNGDGDSDGDMGGANSGSGGNGSGGTASGGNETGGTLMAPVEDPCAGVRVETFADDFDFPNGGIIGVNKQPQTPWWTQSGTSETIDFAASALEAETSVLSAAYTPVAGTGERLRFHFHFEQLSRALGVFMNETSSAERTFGIEVDALLGHVKLESEGTTLATLEAGAALETGTDYFVEAFFEADGTTLALTTGDYSTELGATVVAMEEGLSPTFPADNYVHLLLDDEVFFEEVSIAGCDATLPTPTVYIFDDFNRPDSGDEGNLVIPATASWGDSTNATISGNRLWFSDSRTIGALQSAEHSEDFLHISSVTRFATFGHFFFQMNEEGPVFDIHRQDSNTVTWDWIGGTPGTMSFSLSTTTDYYIDYFVHDRKGVLTLRQDSPTGPVIFADANPAVPLGTDIGLYLGNIQAGGMLRIDELRVQGLP